MIFALADCNNFYCSCERAFRPELNGQPVVVLSNNDGCVIARSNESKALGIKMGDVYYQVRDMLERNNVAVFSSNYTLYGDMSARVMTMLSRVSPRIDVYSIDEAFLDMTGMGTYDDIAARLREVVTEVGRGVGIPISIGLAPTRTLAKVASKFAKKYPAWRGVCAIDNEERRVKALSLTEVGDIWGIGRRHAARLGSMGITNALQLAELPEKTVRRMFSVVGVRTWMELNGISCVCIDEMPHKQTICTSRSFADAGLSRREEVEEAVANYAAACVRKLRRQHTAAGALTVFAHTSAFRSDLPQDYIYATVHLDTATSCLPEIVAAATGVIRANWKGDGVYHYKKAGVIVIDIMPEEAVQPSLFEAERRPRMRALQDAIDAVNRRNGEGAVRTAIQGASAKIQLKRQYISRCYTTNLRDVITVK